MWGKKKGVGGWLGVEGDEEGAIQRKISRGA